ncbi:MAG: aldehyde ferredoxin oxidoreductase C-terminal domain-containing protein [Syntrophales bacterium]|nr:aldehyde ferredoxin oxidoreductase C-terminal domain-containing protein [Syntrophales bacterium]
MIELLCVTHNKTAMDSSWKGIGMHGWRGAILKIDLSSKTFHRENPNPLILRECIGGRGLAGFYLMEHCTRSWDDPLTPLLFFTGPLVDTPSPTSGRMTIMSLSPLTGTVGDSSVGGGLGTMIKRAGWDGIVISGRSESLSGIEIIDDQVLFKDARYLADMRVGDVNSSLPGKGSILAVGPAAEHGVLFSSLVVDGHYGAARNGIGLAFASKNLKYITVLGSGRASVSDEEGLKRATDKIQRLIADSPVLLGEFGIAHFGTPALYDLTHSRRMMPTNNFRKTSFPPAPSMNAFNIKKTYKTINRGCNGCHIQCKKMSNLGEALPEFNTLSHFSALLENEDLSSVIEANRLCNELGMDTISTASTIACHAEIEGRRLSPREIKDLVLDIGEGRGIGIDLGRGSYKYALERGRPESSMSVKGQELPAFDPRGACGMALSYAVSTRGGCHLRAYPIAQEIVRRPVATDRFTFSGKARIIKIAEDQNAAVDSLTACRLVFFAATLEEYAKTLRAVTGIDYTEREIQQAGERTCFRERIMNALRGFTGDDDDLPRRFFLEEGSSGINMPVPPLDRKTFLRARSNYFIARGLDERGIPTIKKADELGLTWKT